VSDCFFESELQQNQQLQMPLEKGDGSNAAQRGHNIPTGLPRTSLNVLPVTPYPPCTVI